MCENLDNDADNLEDKSIRKHYFNKKNIITSKIDPSNMFMF